MLCLFMCLLLLYVSDVNLQIQSVQYETHILKKLKPKSTPIEMGYIYSKINNNPATMTSFGSGIERRSIGTYNALREKLSTSEQYPNENDLQNRDKIIYNSVADKYNSIPKKTHQGNMKSLDEKFDVNPKKIFLESSTPNNLNAYNIVLKDKFMDKARQMPIHIVSRGFQLLDPIESELSEIEMNHDISKANSKYDSLLYPSQTKSDAMYEDLKSVMHYRIPPKVETNYGYMATNNFHIDDDDIRTSSRSIYEDWPFLYHSQYEYEHAKVDPNLEKAKDKRFIVDTNLKYIPVHENHEHDTPGFNNHVHTQVPSSTTDNPISGDNPFISVVLSDYSDRRNVDDDPLFFKGLDTGENFYYDKLHDDEHVTTKRNYRLPNNYEPIHYDSTVLGESATQRGYIKQHEHDQTEKGEAYNTNDATDHEQKHNSNRGFKEFVDAFANKFGSNDHSKQSQYKMKMGQDKGEKRKGFHRVYHKDEYQEDKEFYDNSHVKAHGDEQVNSSLHKGGSEGLLTSHANAAQINDANAYNKVSNTKRGKYNNMSNGYDKVKGLNKGFNQYQDVGKKTVFNNIVDYDYPYNVED